MSIPPVDVLFNEHVEGLEYHEYFERCPGELYVWLLENGVAPVAVTEYRTEARYCLTLRAYCVCEAWLNRFNIGGYGFRVHFEDASAAMLFKLTFGGV